MKHTKCAITIAAAIAMLIGMQSFTECRCDDGGTFGGTLTMNADSPTCLPISGDYTGTTTINAGGSSGSNIALANELNTTSCGTLTIAGTAMNDAFQPVTVSGATLDVSGTSSLVKSGAGTLVLNGCSTYTGATTVYGGTLQIGNSSLGTAGTGNITSSTVQINNATFGGTLNFGNAGTVSGTTTIINAGRWQINNPSAGTLQIGGSGIVSGATLAISGSGGVINSGTINLAGSAGLIKTGTGTITLSNNTFTDATIVNGGTLQISNPGVVVVQPVIGTITLGGNSTYTGASVINAGTLQLSNIDSGTFNIGNSSVYGGLLPNITVAGGTGTLQLSNSVIISGITLAADGNGILTKSGPGTLTLAGSGTYAGLTVVNGGTLQVNSLNTSTLTIGAGATLTIAALPGGPIGSLTPLYNVKPIPEPSVMVLLSIAVLAFIRFGLVPKKSTIRP